MRAVDYLVFALGSLRFSRLRSYLTALGIAVGIASVVLLTALGGGIREYILKEFTQFGTNIITVTPGKINTLGLSGAVINTVRPLTIEDAMEIGRLPNILTSTPLVQGNSEVKHDNRARWTYVYGVNHEVPKTWRIDVSQGKFLPDEPPGQARNLAVIGYKIKEELFPHTSPLGQFIRIKDERYHIIGVMERKGQVLGFDMDDAVYIPANQALSLYNRESLMEIDILFTPGQDEKQVISQIKRLLVTRHDKEDFTIISQSDMLGTLGSILEIFTAVIGGLGGISLLVGGVGIFTIMSIAVNERISEVGLLRALGASRGQVTFIFLLEAAILSALGGLAGMVLGFSIGLGLHWLAPSIPISIAWEYVALSLLIAVLIGIAAGIAPALQAAALHPADALRSE